MTDGKRFLLPAIFVSFALFLLGVLVCYFWLLPKTILFFFRDTESLGWTPTWTVQQYYSFVTRFTIGFGLAFELPVVVLVLVRFGLITYEFMARTRPYAIVLIFILATIITPTPGRAHLDRHEPADVSALRKLHLDRLVHANAAQHELPLSRIAWPFPIVCSSKFSHSFSARSSVRSSTSASIVCRAIFPSIARADLFVLPKKEIPWHQNLPLISWLVLRGRCANCGNKIAFRYFAVELITALLFLALWRSFPWQIAIAYWVFISLLIIATFVDFEHFIIPDEITLGGVAAGIIASFILPSLMSTDRRLLAVAISAGSAALGYAILWLVLEGGKIAFGKKRIRLKQPTAFTWIRTGEDADFVVGEERSLWSDYFAREKDLLLLHCDQATIDDRSLGNVTLQCRYDLVTVGDETLSLDKIDRISGVVRELQIPREAMGRGDLKFLAAIGAFLSWRAVFFTIFAGSLLGSVVGLTTLMIGKRVWSAKLPFGPYLAAGALIWMFFGDSLLAKYVSLLSP